MPRQTNVIPVNTMTADEGIAIGKVSFKALHIFEEAAKTHRDDYHLFFIQEKGTTPIEVDFRKYNIKPCSVTYVHPNQVHRIGGIKNGTISVLIINNENLQPDYRKWLDEITPAYPLSLDQQTFSVIRQTASLCVRLAKRQKEKLYYATLKDACNTLVALIIAAYLQQTTPADKLSRFEVFTKAFRILLEKNFITDKKPAAYAAQLNISVPYLNECIKNITGHPVSYHISQRVILEAKRLLTYSDKSVKEIATILGYDDYPYFSRLFSKVTGMTALAFRNKNLD